jgi:hypothetical protein
MEGGSSHALSGTPANPPPLADNHRTPNIACTRQRPVNVRGHSGECAKTGGFIGIQPAHGYLVNAAMTR